MNRHEAATAVLAISMLMASVSVARATTQQDAHTDAGHHDHASSQLQASDCPMHAEHARAEENDEHAHGVDQRGDQAMGFSHLKTTHHFLLTKDGGVIQVTANSADDAESLNSIRQHLKHISAAFTAGDFELPEFIHDRTPPGVPQMKTAGNEISYTYREIDRGAQVVIATKDPKALPAIQDFLRFQIAEHRTGDVATVR